MNDEAGQGKGEVKLGNYSKGMGCPLNSKQWIGKNSLRKGLGFWDEVECEPKPDIVSVLTLLAADPG